MPDARDEYPRAIVHFDGDSFFASVEQMLDWRLRGKPVVTGGERGAATSLSIEAKRRGLHRGVPMQEIRRLAPDAVIVPGNYTAYSIFGKRMYEIARVFTPLVEEYSIDECFVDVTDAAVAAGMSHEAYAAAIKVKLQESLGITFGVGLAPTKTLAKVASKLNKPDGLTLLPRSRIDETLAGIPIHDVWGIGGSMSMALKGLGIETALDLARKPRAWMDEHRFAKPVRVLALELAGVPVRTVGGEHAHGFKSVMHTRTFTPPSSDRAFLFAQLSKNLEAACVKLRRRGARACTATFYLKTQEFTYHSVQMTFHVPLNDPSSILELFSRRFHEVFAPGILYRATGVTLHTIVPNEAAMPSLFGKSAEEERRERSLACVDFLNKRWGNDSVFLGSTLLAMRERTDLVRSRAKPVSRRRNFLSCGEGSKKCLGIPFLGKVR
jgi:DNA polymerase-4/DNA polymerase V